MARFGEAVPACIPDPERHGKGMCVVQAAPMNRQCKRYGEFRAVRGQSLLGSRAKADVCLPAERPKELVGKACEAGR
jgi:hypothetical protein